MSLRAIDDMPIEDVAYGFRIDSAVDVGADAFTLTRGSFTALAQKWAGPVCNNNTKTSELQFSWVVPPEFPKSSSISAAAGEVATQKDFVLRLRAQRTGTPTTTKTIDVVASRIVDGAVDTSIGVSGELCETAAVDLNLNTPTDHDFTIDGEDLEPGDLVNFAIRTVMNDTGGAGGGAAEIFAIEIPDLPYRG